MIKTLTQEVFKDVPEWVESVAVDEVCSWYIGFEH